MCTAPSCDRPLYAKGYCTLHYRRGPDAKPMRNRRPKWPDPCIAGDCPRPVVARGMCSLHWKRWRKTGSTADPTMPTEAERFASYVDRSGDCWLWTGGLNVYGYPVFWSDGRQVRAHRYAYEHEVGPVPEGLELDHTCHNADGTCPGGVDCVHRRCVNPAHLEPVTGAENMRRSVARRAEHGIPGPSRWS